MSVSPPLQCNDQVVFSVPSVSCQQTCELPGIENEGQLAVPATFSSQVTQRMFQPSINITDRIQPTSSGGNLSYPQHPLVIPTNQRLQHHRVPHNGCFGEYPFSRFTCQRLTANHNCRDPPTTIPCGKLNQTLFQCCLASPFGIQPGVAQLQHEHVVCGRGTRAFGLGQAPTCASGRASTSTKELSD